MTYRENIFNLTSSSNTDILDENNQYLSENVTEACIFKDEQNVSVKNSISLSQQSYLTYNLLLSYVDEDEIYLPLTLCQKIHYLYHPKKVIHQALDLDNLPEAVPDPILDLKYNILSRMEHEPSRSLYKSRSSISNSKSSKM